MMFLLGLFIGGILVYVFTRNTKIELKKLEGEYYRLGEKWVKTSDENRNLKRKMLDVPINHDCK